MLSLITTKLYITWKGTGNSKSSQVAVFLKENTASIFKVASCGNVWVEGRVVGVGPVNTVLVVMHRVQNPEVNEVIDPIKLIAIINLIDLINMQMT